MLYSEEDMRGGCGFVYILYNCIASAWIGGVWRMDGAVLRYADAFKPAPPFPDTTPLCGSGGL